ncbi:hypothetical protein CASFOL_040866 [Castilleja foliolosa]|uniref:Ubiquitin-like domain-containing protein n=1 Tax=Castilleja foliolosa TaxID=1961234 RepID=A0ABD3BEF2_9LAMI
MMMMKRKLNFNRRRREGVVETTTSCSSAKDDDDVEWEMRPGGMLVQMRSQNSSGVIVNLPDLRVRVEYGVVRYQISASSLSTFGELKKLLTAETGLQPGEQRLIFRGKERENGEYLDTCGVKDRSKVVLIEDPESKERRMIEMRRNAKIQAVHQLIDDVAMEVDKLAEQTIYPGSVSEINSDIPELKGDNYKVWRERVLLQLGWMDIDYAIRKDEPSSITEADSHENVTKNPIFVESF